MSLFCLSFRLFSVSVSLDMLILVIGEWGLDKISSRAENITTFME